jgi:hypothetical protein
MADKPTCSSGYEYRTSRPSNLFQVEGGGEVNARLFCLKTLFHYGNAEQRRHKGRSILHYDDQNRMLLFLQRKGLAY